MKSEMVKEKRTADKIIAAATELFARKGFAAVSVKELADAAGVNVALISYYFGGKERLYTVVLERQFAIMADLLDTVNKAQLSPVEKLRRFADLVVEVHKQATFMDQLIYGEKINPTGCFDVILQKEAARVHYFLRDAITEAIAAGQFRPDLDPDSAAIALGGIINIYFCIQPLARHYLPERDDQAEYYVSQAVDIYIKGVMNLQAS